MLTLEPLTTGHDFIRVFSILYYHFIFQILDILKVNGDINQQDFKLEVVNRVSETQLQKSENSNKILGVMGAYRVYCCFILSFCFSKRVNL